MGLTKLVVRGARQHNLKNINIEIPRNTLTVITGLSGSGKSSLAFDTIYAEGQRRYVESLSAYARQFLDQMERPEVDVIEGLSPSIAIEQKTTTRSPRSTCSPGRRLKTMRRASSPAICLKTIGWPSSVSKLQILCSFNSAEAAPMAFWNLPLRCSTPVITPETGERLT